MIQNISKFIKQRQTAILFISILILAAIIRFNGLTLRSIWGDEVHSINRTLELTRHLSMLGGGNLASYFILLKETIQAIFIDSHLPLYFFLLSLWAKVFGTGEYALRFFSAILGMLSVGAIFFLAKRMFNERIAIISSLFLSISGLSVLYSQDIRMYSLLVFVSILSTIYFWKRFNDGSRSDLIAYFIFTLLLCSTHIFAILVFAGHMLFLAAYLFQNRFREKQKVFLLCVQAVFLALISPLYIQYGVMVFTNLTSATDIAYSAFPFYLKIPLFFFVLSLGETVSPFNLLVAAPAMIVFGFLFLRAFKFYKQKEFALLLFIVIVNVLIASLFKGSMPKYLIGALPFYIILLACSLESIKNQIIKIVLILFVVLFSAVSINNCFTLSEYHNSNQIEPWREVSRIIGEGFKRGDVIVCSNNYLSGNILRYYFMKAHKDKEINFEDMGNISHKGDIHGIGPARIWLVSHISDDRSNRYRDVAVFRKNISRRYKLIDKWSFVPYEQTVVSKIPINRHRPKSSRILVELFLRKGR